MVSLRLKILFTAQKAFLVQKRTFHWPKTAFPRAKRLFTSLKDLSHPKGLFDFPRWYLCVRKDFSLLKRAFLVRKGLSTARKRTFLITRMGFSRPKVPITTPKGCFRPIGLSTTFERLFLSERTFNSPKGLISCKMTFRYLQMVFLARKDSFERTTHVCVPDNLLKCSCACLRVLCVEN